MICNSNPSALRERETQDKGCGIFSAYTSCLGDCTVDILLLSSLISLLELILKLMEIEVHEYVLMNYSGGAQYHPYHVPHYIFTSSNL
jgi:hypothetical protein